MPAPRRTSRFAWFAGLLLLAAAVGIPAYLYSRGKADSGGPVTPTDTLDVVCTGRVDARDLVIALDPSQAGRVVEVFVKEGAAVKAGQPIVKIDDRTYEMQVTNSEAALAAAELELDMAMLRLQNRPGQIEVFELKIAAAKATMDGLQAKATQLKKQLELVAGSSTIPITQADVDAAQAQVDSLKKTIDAEAINLKQSKAFDAGKEVRGYELKRDSAKEMVKQARTLRDECVVKAPADGTIIRLQTARGATLIPASPLDPAIVFAPAGPLVVRAEVEQADLARVKVGMAAVLKDDTRREAMTLTGKVTEVARWVAPKKKMLLDPGEFNDVRTTEVLIALDPTDVELRIGQRILVRITEAK